MSNNDDISDGASIDNINNHDTNHDNTIKEDTSNVSSNDTSELVRVTITDGAVKRLTRLMLRAQELQTFFTIKYNTADLVHYLIDNMPYEALMAAGKRSNDDDTRRFVYDILYLCFNALAECVKEGDLTKEVGTAVCRFLHNIRVSYELQQIS
jgi:hypothetical protein